MTDFEKLTAGKTFSKNQLKEIAGGLRDNTPIDQVAFYADPKFDYNQMRQIRIGLKNNLTLQQIKT